MVGSAGISGAAVAIAVEAERTAHCSATMPQYHHAGASIDQMRDYASCVSRVYGEMGAGEIWAMKIAILITVAAIIAGAAIGWRQDRDVAWAGLAGMIGATLSWIVMLIVAEVWFVAMG